MFRRNDSSSNANTGTQPSWKAAGFINLYLPLKRPDGTIVRTKFAGVPLKDASDKALLAMLRANPEATLAKIKEHLVLEYRAADVNEGATFAFSLDVPLAEQKDGAMH